MDKYSQIVRCSVCRVPVHNRYKLSSHFPACKGTICRLLKGRCYFGSQFQSVVSCSKRGTVWQRHTAEKVLHPWQPESRQAGRSWRLERALLAPIPSLPTRTHFYPQIQLLNSSMIGPLMHVAPHDPVPFQTQEALGAHFRSKP